MSKKTDNKNPYAIAIFFAIVAIFFIIDQKKKNSINYNKKTLGWILRLRNAGNSRGSNGTTIEYKYLVDGIWKRGEYDVSTGVNSTNTRSGIFRKGTYYYVKYDKDQPDYSKLIKSGPIPKEKGRKMRDSIFKLYNK
jgi:hypothetical protein